MAIYSCTNVLFLSVSFLTIIKVLHGQNSHFITLTNRKLTFLADDNYVLGKKQVENQFSCGQFCLKTPSCRSFNLEKKSKKIKRECELLSIDKNNKNLLKDDNNFDYYILTVSMKLLQKNRLFV